MILERVGHLALVQHGKRLYAVRERALTKYREDMTEADADEWCSKYEPERIPAQWAKAVNYADTPAPTYCTQNGGECWTCSLASLGRDCQGQRIE